MEVIGTGYAPSAAVVSSCGCWGVAAAGEARRRGRDNTATNESDFDLLVDLAPGHGCGATGPPRRVKPASSGSKQMAFRPRRTTERQWVLAIRTPGQATAVGGGSTQVTPGTPRTTDARDGSCGGPKDDGFPTLSTTESALRMPRVTIATVSLVPRGQRRQRPLLVALLLLAGTCAAIAVLVQVPLLPTEPLYVVVNVLVTTSMILMGSYLISRQRERFTGAAFVIAGVFWLGRSVEIYLPWGPLFSWLFSGAGFYTAISWGILRYGRVRLETRSERLFIPFCAIFIAGSCAILATVSFPEWLAYPTNSYWLTIWPSEMLSTVFNLGACAGYAFIAIYFCVLSFRKLHSTAHFRRGILRPLVWCGSGWAAVATTVTIVMSLAPASDISAHATYDIIGILSFSLTAALVVAIARQQLMGSSFVNRLPAIRTPESVAKYVREILQDPTAELLFWSPAVDSLIDANGRRRVLAHEARNERFLKWVHGDAGERVALLTCHRLLGQDPAALEEFTRVVGILAENAQLHAVLRMQLAQLTALRTAEQLALIRAREEFHRDLHDGLQQTIAAARLDLDGVRDAVVDECIALADLDEKLQVALEQVQSLKSGQRPPELSFGLKAALDRTISQLRLQAHLDVPDIDLGIMTMPVYYIICESLTNIHKHAEAGELTISVSSDGRTIDVLVQDDGRGGAIPRVGGGLAGVKKRVSELGGQLSLDSPIGGGTTVRASVPCVS